MARITLTDSQIIAFHPAFAAASASTGVVDLGGDLIVTDESVMVATNETIADWIAARGEPTKTVGGVAVFDETALVATGRGNRTARRGTTVYVLPTDFGTVAIVAHR